MVDIFGEDVVAILNNENEVVHYGTVVRTQDSYSSDDEDEDDYRDQLIKEDNNKDSKTSGCENIKNNISNVDKYLSVICYPRGLNKNFGKTNLLVLDRNLYPGSYVRRFLKNIDSQRGVVINSRVFCDLKVPTMPFYICNVNSTELMPLIPLYIGCEYVLFNSWVGKIDQIEHKSLLSFNDGAMCELSGDAHEELYNFDDVNEKDSDKNEFDESDFYDGQILRGSMDIFRQAKWLVSTKLHSQLAAKKHRKKKVTVTIKKTEITKVEVIWLTCGYQNSGEEMPQQPDRNIIGDNILKLKAADMQSSNRISIGEKYYLHISPNHKIIPQSNYKSLKCFKSECTHNYNFDLYSEHKSFNEVQFSKQFIIELNNYHEVKLKIKNSKEEMLETKKECTPKRKSSFSCSLNKCRKKRSSQSACESVQKLELPSLEPTILDLAVGAKFPVKVACKMTLVDVLWQDGTVEMNIPSTQLYPIEYLDDREFFPGNFVVMDIADKKNTMDYGVVNKVDHVERTCCISWLKSDPIMGLQVDNVSTEVSVHDIKLYTEFSYDIGSYVLLVDKSDVIVTSQYCMLGCVKFVKENGKVLVSWFDGEEAEVHPHQLFLLSILDEDTIDDDDKSSATYSSSENDVSYGNSDDDDGSNSSNGWVTEEENDSKSDTARSGTLSSICKEFCCNLVGLMTVLKINDTFSPESYSFKKEFDEFLNYALKLIEINIRSSITPYKDILLSHFKCSNIIEKNLHLAFLDFFYKNFYLIEQKNIEIMKNVNDFKFIEFKKKLHLIFTKSSSITDINKYLSDHITENCSYNGILETSHAIIQFPINLTINDSKSVDDELTDDKNLFIGAIDTIVNNIKEETISITNGQEISKAYKINSNIINKNNTHNSIDIEKELCSSNSETKTQNICTNNSLNIIENDSNGDEYFDCLNDIEESAISCINSTDKLTDTKEKFVRISFNNVDTKFETYFIYKMDLSSEETGMCNIDKLKYTNTNFLDVRMIDIFESFKKNVLVFDEEFYERSKDNDYSFYISIFHFYKSLSLIDYEDINFIDWLDCIIFVINKTNNCDTNKTINVQLSPFILLLESCFKILSDFDKSCAIALSHLVKLFESKVFEKVISDFSWTGVSSKKVHLYFEMFKNKELDNSYMFKLIMMLINTILRLNKNSLLSNNDWKVGKDSNKIVSTLEGDGDINVGENIEEVFNSVIDDLPKQVVEEIHPIATKDSISSIALNDIGFILLEDEPVNHHFNSTVDPGQVSKNFLSAIHKDHKLLKSCLPVGIYVKAFSSRIDLFTAMIVGPQHTPYEDGLFFFDIQLPQNYPQVPPKFHYLSFCSDRLNPNLYEDGKVCVSLLGTWSGKGTEVWSAKTSNLLQVLVSIQGLILNSEPYYNEAGFERHKGCQEGRENSRMYNEVAIIKLLQSTSKMLEKPCIVFKEEIFAHFFTTAKRFVQRHEGWLAYGNNTDKNFTAIDLIGNLEKKFTPATNKNLNINTKSIIMQGVQNEQFLTKLDSDFLVKPTEIIDNTVHVDSLFSLPDTEVSNTGISVLVDIENTSLKSIKSNTETSLDYDLKDFDKQSEKKASSHLANNQSEFLELNSKKHIMPEFTLLPISKGFRLSLRKYLDQLKESFIKYKIPY